jgi:hypothetical protein
VRGAKDAAARVVVAVGLGALGRDARPGRRLARNPPAGHHVSPQMRTACIAFAAVLTVLTVLLGTVRPGYA